MRLGEIAEARFGIKPVLTTFLPGTAWPRLTAGLAGVRNGAGWEGDRREFQPVIKSPGVSQHSDQAGRTKIPYLYVPQK